MRVLSLAITALLAAAGTAVAARPQQREPAAQNVKDPDALFKQGVEEEKAGNLDEAAQAYWTAVKLRPSFLEARVRLGQVYLQLERPQHAVEEFAQAARLDPARAELHVLLGAAYAAQSKFDEAAIKPHHVHFYDIARSYQSLGKKDEAVAALQESLRIKPEFVFGRYDLGIVYFQQGRHEEAVEAFGEVVRLEPAHVGANFKLGLSYLYLGNKNAAVQQYHALRNIDPNFARQLYAAIRR